MCVLGLFFVKYSIVLSWQQIRVLLKWVFFNNGFYKVTLSLPAILTVELMCVCTKWLPLSESMLLLSVGLVIIFFGVLLSRRAIL